MYGTKSKADAAADSVMPPPAAVRYSPPRLTVRPPVESCSKAMNPVWPTVSVVGLARVMLPVSVNPKFWLLAKSKTTDPLTMPLDNPAEALLLTVSAPTTASCVDTR